jgi:hypothetical protein
VKSQLLSVYEVLKWRLSDENNANYSAHQTRYSNRQYSSLV